MPLQKLVKLKLKFIDSYISYLGVPCYKFEVINGTVHSSVWGTFKPGDYLLAAQESFWDTEKPPRWARGYEK